MESEKKNGPDAAELLRVREFCRTQAEKAGKDGAQAEISFEREIDLHGNLLMPGFKDAHTHSPMTFLRSYADDMPLQDWLYKQVFPIRCAYSSIVGYLRPICIVLRIIKIIITDIWYRVPALSLIHI